MTARLNTVQCFSVLLFMNQNQFLHFTQFFCPSGKYEMEFKSANKWQMSEKGKLG